MHLTNRPLSQNLEGDDVRLLHAELQRLDYVFPENEFAKAVFGEGTLQVVYAFQKSSRLPRTGVVDQPTVDAINAALRAAGLEPASAPGAPPPTDSSPEPAPAPPAAPPRVIVLTASLDFSVSGQVRRPDGRPLPDLTVVALDQDLRTHQELGKTTTDAKGGYQILYGPDRFSRAEKGHADLRLQVFDAQGTLLQQTGIHFHAPPQATIDLVFEPPRTGSEYEELLATLAPLLQDLGLWDLNAEDVAFLAGESELPAERIDALARAARLGRDADLAEDLCYGLARQGLPMEIDALLAVSEARIRDALMAAIAQGQIPSGSEAAIEGIFTRLADLRVDHALRATPAGSQGTLGDLLATALPDPGQARTLVSLHLLARDKRRDLWELVAEHPDFQDEKLVRDLRYTVDLGALTGMHLPLVRTLQADFHSVRALAKLDEAGWRKLLDREVEGQPIGAPRSVDGAAMDLDAYARSLARAVELRHPTAVVAARLKQGAVPALAPVAKVVARFLDAAEDFELGEGRMAERLEKNGQALDQGEDPEAARSALEKLERLAKISLSFQAMKPLLEDGVSSAHQIAEMGRDAFLSLYVGRAGSVEAAIQIYARAEAVVGLTTAILAEHVSHTANPNWNVAPPRGNIPPPKEEIRNAPTWRTLFGSLGICGCGHCRTITSPAAYLVELLSFLERGRWEKTEAPASPGEAPPSGLDALRERRPDILEIELSCANTDTLVATVDLVNEVLEEAARPGARPARQRQTSGTQAERDLEPEHVHGQVYTELLRTAVLAPELPLDLAWEQSRLYLERLGTTREALIEAFCAPGDDRDLAMAGERLGLAPAEIGYVQGTMGGKPLYEFYGFIATHLGDVPWTELVAQVPVFLARTGFDGRGLDALLGTTFLQQDRAEGAKVALRFGADPCDLDQAFLANLDDGALQRAHRMLRLARRSGWGIAELDRLLSGLGVTEIDDAALMALAHVRRLQAELRMEPDQLLELWSPPAGGSDARVAVLARALRREPEEVEALILALGSPFASPADTARWLGLARKTLATPLPLDQVAFVLDQGPCPPEVEPSAARLEETAGDLVTRLRAFDLSFPEVAEHLAEDEVRALFARVLATRLGAEQAQEVQDLLSEGRVWTARYRQEAASPLPAVPEALRDRISYDEGSGLLRSKGMLSAAGRDALKETPNADGKWREAADRLYAAPRQHLSNALGDLNDASGVYNLEWIRGVARSLYSAARADALRATLVESLGGAFRLDPQLAGALLEGVRLGQVSLLGVLSAEDRVASALLPRLQVLRLAVLIVRAFELTTDELRALLPARLLGHTLGKPLTVAQWEDLCELRALRRGLRRSQALPAVFSKRGSDAAQALALATGWEEREIAAFLGIRGDAPSPIRSVAAVVSASSALALLRRLGLPATSLQDWVRPPTAATPGDPEGILAEAVKSALRRRYDAARWRDVARPLQDALRERRRQALVAWLTRTKADLDSPAKLFEHYLIDVEMGARQRTSRIKQAISSVQLFVQRCMMSLEPVRFAPDDVVQWRWMKAYRLWEANRKVFLYPENWIEPELRDDKSPFFQDLENELMQDEVTEEAAEKAVRSYLEKLDEVARLEICGMYHQFEEYELGGVATDVLHVFGRTRHAPHVYYYRRLMNGTVWTAWEKVELEIRGEHLIPVVFERRLYLFWAVFTECADRPGGATAPQPRSTSQPPQTAVERAWMAFKSRIYAALDAAQGRSVDHERVWLKLQQVSTAHSDLVASASSGSGGTPTPETQRAELLMDTIRLNAPRVASLAGLGSQADPFITALVAAHEDLARQTSSSTTTLSTLPVPQDQPGCWDIQLAWSEYRGAKWSRVNTPREKVQIGRPGRYSGDMYTVCGDHHATSPREIFFRAFVEGDTLHVRGAKLASRIEHNGTWAARELIEFTLDGCRGRLRATLVNPSQDRTLAMPEGAPPEYQTFAAATAPSTVGAARIQGRISAATSAVARLGSSHRLVYPQQYLTEVFPAPLFLEDSERTFFLWPRVSDDGGPDLPPAAIDLLAPVDIPCDSERVPVQSMSLPADGTCQRL